MEIGDGEAAGEGAGHERRAALVDGGHEDDAGFGRKPARAERADVEREGAADAGAAGVAGADRDRGGVDEGRAHVGAVEEHLHRECRGAGAPQAQERREAGARVVEEDELIAARGRAGDRAGKAGLGGVADDRCRGREGEREEEGAMDAHGAA